MRLWSSELLEAELANGQVSEREKVKYLLLPMLLAGLSGGPLGRFAPRYGERPPSLDSALALLTGALMIWVVFYGMRNLYRINRRIDGHHFIERYTVLVLPASVRFFAGMIPLLVVLIVVLRALGRSIDGSADSLLPFYRLIFPVVTLVFYRVLARSFSRFGGQLRRAQRAGPAVPQAAP